MMAMLKGKPLTSIDGDRSMDAKNPATFSGSRSLKSAMRTVPTMVVVRHVSAKRTTLIQGNGREESSAVNNSAGRVNVLSMKRLTRDLQRLQVFAGLKSHCLSWGDIHFGAGSRIAPDPGFARLYGKNTEAA